MKNFTKPRFFRIFYLIIAVFANLAITSCLEQGTSEPGPEQGLSDYRYYKIVNGQKVLIGSEPDQTNQLSPPPATTTPPSIDPGSCPNPGQTNPPPSTNNNPAGKTKRSFTWNHNGQNYTMEVWLNNSVNYKNPEYAPEADYYSKFLITEANDNSINDIAQWFRNTARTQRLNDDQVVGLLASFVQSGIPYNSSTTTPKFPYQTLLDGSGDCDDKSLLAYKLLDELGYGVALISMPNHMAIGISCAPGLSFNNSGFAYLEISGPGKFAVGQMPPERNRSNFSFIAPHKGGKIYGSPIKITA